MLRLPRQLKLGDGFSSVGLEIHCFDEAFNGPSPVGCTRTVDTRYFCTRRGWELVYSFLLRLETMIHNVTRCCDSQSDTIIPNAKS